MRFTLLGKTNIQTQLDSEYWQNIATYNENVAKNRFILSKLIDAVRFCGAFELAPRGQDESGNSANTGIFQGLINYSAELDKTLKKFTLKKDRRIDLVYKKVVYTGCN